VEAVGGRYRLVEQIGTGGMSVVWRGQDAVLGRAVAVKVLAEGYVSDAAFRDRMRREARAAARLCHPQVNTVYDFGEDEDTAPYMVMELIDGPSLAEVLKTGPVPWRRAVGICADVAAGLAAAHAAGLVHRDVKPGNVMLGSTGTKLVDFGISAEIGEAGDLAHDGVVLGTPAYVAPERLTGSPALPASDVYALGVLLYKSLTGRLPWDVDTKTEVLRAHLATAPRPLPRVADMPLEVADACERCLAKHPDDRPSAHDLALVCQRALESTEELPTAPLAIPRVPALRLVRKRVRKLVHGPRRIGLVAAGILALGGVAVTTAFADSSPRSTPPAAQGPAQVRAEVGAVSTPCQVTYRLRTDDGQAFTGELTVTNTGDKPLADEILTFMLPGTQQINATGWSQTGTTVGVRPGALDPGDEHVLPFQGTYTGTNAMPNGFALGGYACDPVLIGVSGVPATPGPTASATTAAQNPAPRPVRPDPTPTPTGKRRKHGGGDHGGN
jgi:eukaryotic-like serine/threonine-protein kinase